MAFQISQFRTVVFIPFFSIDYETLVLQAFSFGILFAIHSQAPNPGAYFRCIEFNHEMIKLQHPDDYKT